MRREEILQVAINCVIKDRNHDYGNPEDSFSLIAKFWDAYLDGRTANAVEGPIDGYDVGVMLALMKVARMTNRPTSPDSAVDLAGYAACAGEILDKINGSGVKKTGT